MSATQPALASPPAGAPEADGGRRSARFLATRAEILEAAWALSREVGLGTFTMRDLGARVGMRAQSLYVYFPSKLAIYDAMFAAANQELLARMRGLPTSGDPVADLKVRAHAFLGFAVEDLARYQLLFQRTIPGFEPSPASYAAAVEVLRGGHAALAACGVTDPAARDLYTALLGGLAAQQNSNEPGGRRWTALVDGAIDMFLAYHGPGRTS